MNLNTRIVWPAWAWVNSTVDIISNIFAKLWYYLVTDIEYESRIKWGINYFDVNISDDENVYLSNKVDIVLAFNANGLLAQIESLKKDSTIIINSKYLDNIKEKLDKLKNLNILSLNIKDKYDNTYLLWIYGKYLNIDKEIILNEVKTTFQRKWEDAVNHNLDIINDIYLNYNLNKKTEIKIEKNWEEKTVIYWNKAIALWAIEGWLEFYSAYPMTPASSILTEVINDWRIKYIQNEDEIAVINSALWASFTWLRSMSWTSGWWFALMTEAISFAVQAEIPITIAFSQRAGPSTWTPTYHEAWDLNFALNPSFWDFEHVVLYPSNIEEAYYFAWLALNIADKYQTQVILLTDKQASEMHVSVSKLNAAVIDRWVILETPPTDYKRYEITESWISPRVKVWTINWDFIATSYEHDEFWATTEKPEIKKLMTEQRWRKLNNFFEKEGYKWYEIINKDAKKMLVTTSFISYTAKKFIKENKDFWLIIIKFLKPLDFRLKEELIWKEELIFIENNYSGQLEKYITKEFSLDNMKLKISNLRKYDLLPFYIEDFNSLKNK